MKLVSLHIYKWQSEACVLLAAEIDVNSLWFYQRAMAKEHINFNSRLIAG